MKEVAINASSTIARPMLSRNSRVRMCRGEIAFSADCVPSARYQVLRFMPHGGLCSLGGIAGAGGTIWGMSMAWRDVTVSAGPDFLEAMGVITMRVASSSFRRTFWRRRCYASKMRTPPGSGASQPVPGRGSVLNSVEFLIAIFALFHGEANTKSGGQHGWPPPPADRRGLHTLERPAERSRLLDKARRDRSQTCGPSTSGGWIDSRILRARIIMSLVRTDPSHSKPFRIAWPVRILYRPGRR